jgi:hypothetical protein
MRAAILACLVAGCAATPPGAARIETHAENGEARVVRVDGRTVLGGAVVELAPGRHRLGVYCRYNLSIMIGDAQSIERELEVELEPGTRYRLQAGMAPAPCTMRLVKESP